MRLTFSTIVLFFAIPSLTAADDAVILQISDFHLDPDYSIDGDTKLKCHKDESPPNVAASRLGPFGDYMCDSAEKLVRNAVKAAAEQYKNPTAIVWTGDSIAHVDKYDVTYVINTIKKVTDIIKEYFPDTIVLPTYGNHDHWPSDQFDESDQEFYEKTLDLWKGWISKGHKDAEKNFKDHGYYRYDMGKTMFLVLNNNYYYLPNKRPMQSDPADQFSWLTDNLKEATAKGRPVHIVSHIPPGYYERKPNFPWMADNYTSTLQNIFAKYSNTIKTMFFGHHHSDTFHVLYNEKKEPVQTMWISPSVTPWYSSLGKGANNPSFRLFVYDSVNNWDLKDVETYFVDLDKLNNDPKTKWELEYSFKKAYNLDSLSAEQMDKLVGRLKEDGGLFEKYLKYNSVSHEEKDAPKYSEELTTGQLCSLQYITEKSYKQCLEGSSSATRATIGFILLLISVSMFRF